MQILDMLQCLRCVRVVIQYGAGRGGWAVREGCLPYKEETRHVSL
jgi:hypothetical protein